MDWWTFLFSNTAKEITSTLILVGVVLSIFTGVLVPGRTHKRELAAANKVADAERAASEKKDLAISRLLEQNGTLLAGVRIADKYYADFLPAVDDMPKPRRAEVRDVLE